MFLFWRRYVQNGGFCAYDIVTIDFHLGEYKAKKYNPETESVENITHNT